MSSSRRTFLRLCAVAPLVRVAPRPRLVCFGDSITLGQGATTSSQGYAAIVARTLGYVLDNRAIVGSLLAEQQIVTMQPPDLALLLTGYNDMRYGTELEVYQAQLTQAVATLTASGARLLLGDCLRMTRAGYVAFAPERDRGSDAAVAGFNAVIHRMHGCLVRASAAFDPANMNADLVHPNNAGHAQIAAAFLVALRPRTYLSIVRRG